MTVVETVAIGASASEAPSMAPLLIALSILVLGSALAVGGVYLLAGLGWALIAAATPTILVAVIMLRGVKHA